MFQPRTMIRVMVVGCLLLAISAPLGAIAPQLGDHGPEMDPWGAMNSATDHGPTMDPFGLPLTLAPKAEHGPEMDPWGVS